MLRLTEIWTKDDKSETIQLAEPNLNDYKEYPELMLVDTKFCVKAWQLSLDASKIFSMSGDGNLLYLVLLYFGASE